MAVGKRPPPFANAVDNLGAKSTPISSCSLARESSFVLRAREHRFNRSSTIPSFVTLAPVEKNGPDFHRLAVQICSKSHIRSVPKSGSGVVTFREWWLEWWVSALSAACTGLVRLSRPCLLPCRDCNKGQSMPQGIEANG